MKLNLSRRDVLQLGAGGAVGVMLTPAPWKAMDDLAIWTQNWSWIPRPPKGPESMRASVCALCPTGCPLQMRCIGGLPVSMRAAAADSPLCPLGLTGHHLPYHPARIGRSFRQIRSGTNLRRIPVPIDTVLAAAASAIGEAKHGNRAVVVLDTRPDRSVSWAWQAFLGGIAGGVYVPAPGREGASFSTLEQMSGDRAGIDVDRVRTILSFGAPLADGFGGTRLIARIRSGETRILHVDAVRSRTADIAARWLPARSGSEAALACGIGNALMSIGAVDSDASYERFTPASVAATTGLPAEAIVAAARELAANDPAAVIAGEGFGRTTEEAIHNLNLLLADSAIVSRPELPPPFADAALAPSQEIDQLADASVALLLIDASAGDVRFPWSVIRPKLHGRAVVVALTPFIGGTAQHADYIVPALPFLESVHELPTAFDAPAPRLAISAAILPPRKEGVDPAAFIRQLARETRIDVPGQWTKTEELIRARVAAIHASGAGNVITPADGTTKALSEFGSADELWDALAGGAKWEGERGSPMCARPRPAVASVEHPDNTLRLIVRTPRDVTASAAVSPLMTKLYQESGLRRSGRAAVVNPTTARQLGIAAGAAARVETAGGAVAVVLATDSTVMPGVIEMSVAPGTVALDGRTGVFEATVLDAIKPDASGSWRSVAARLVEA